MKKKDRPECSFCGALLTVEKGIVYRYKCPKCDREGCDTCMPAGNGCMCPECEGTAGFEED